MRRTNRETTIQLIKSIPLPKQTRSYTVIPHGVVIDLIEKAIERCGFEVSKVRFTSNHNYRALYGTYYLKADDDMYLTFNFTNSYDKTECFISAPGLYVVLTDNNMLSDSSYWKRKHTGTSDMEAYDNINHSMTQAKYAFEEMKKDITAFKNAMISPIEFGKLLGEMYARKLITSSELNDAWKYGKKPPIDFKLPKGNIWILYNAVLNAVKDSGVKKLMERQILIHRFFKEKYNVQPIFDLQ